MNVNLTLTKDYRKKDDFVVRINKPNFRNGQNERKLICYRGLQKKRLFSTPKNKPNSNPISSKAKMNANAFSQKDYENETAFRPKKTNPIKANFKRKDSLHKQCYLLYLKGSFATGHLGRYWQTKPKVSDELLRTGKEIRFRF